MKNVIKNIGFMVLGAVIGIALNVILTSIYP